MTKLQLIKKAKSELRKQSLEFKQSLNECTSVLDIRGKWYLKQFITPATGRKNLSLSELKAEIIKTHKNRKAKELIKEIANIENIFNSGDVTEVKITIEWKKSATWGANPTATIEIYGDNYERHSSGVVSGCGFCKESTAFANGINQSNAIKKLLLSKSKKIENNYGHRNGLLSGGVGTSCYYSIFENLGFKMIKVSSGKMFDAYHIIKIKK